MNNQSRQIRDRFGSAGVATFTLPVRNLPATLGPISGPTVAVRGQALAFTGRFTDPGTSDTHVVTIPKVWLESCIVSLPPAKEEALDAALRFSLSL